MRRQNIFNCVVVASINRMQFALWGNLDLNLHTRLTGLILLERVLVNICVGNLAVVCSQRFGLQSSYRPNLALAVSCTCYKYCLRSATTLCA
jgi:hypothetical protein